MHECVIGIWNDYENTEQITALELKEKIEQEKSLYEYSKKYMDIGILPPKPIYDYLDKRKSTNLQRFDYCPYCGKKIDWKGLRENESKAE